MHASEAQRAIAAAISTASSLGLTADDAIVIQDSNRITLRLLPCDVLAQVSPSTHAPQFEIDLAQRLIEAGAPVAAPEPRVEPRVYEQDGFLVTFWTYYEPLDTEISPADYADALARLHAGMRKIDYPTPHFTDRIESAQLIASSRDHSPELADDGRELLSDVLRRLRRTVGESGAPEQLLHGEPHPGNLLATKNGPLFIDLETCCRGPVEFDLAHAPDEVGDHYPGIDQDLLRECRVLMLALITAWRWDPNDHLPDGRRLGLEGLDQLRAVRS